MKQVNKSILLVLILLSISLLINAKVKPFTVVIDPGHGGKDPGATRAGVCESNINLDIALLVGSMLEKHHDIKVVYTRKTDKTLEPVERMETANKANGDIFVSIHVNSAYNEAKKRDVTTTHGVEVYIQTVENTDRKTRTLKQKSSITSIGENGVEVSKRYDENNSPTFNAIYEIKQAQIFNLSNNLATYIGNEMGEKERKIRGVKQQSLYVTWQTIVPSVLVEVGYITNPEERAFMTSKDGQRNLATGIYNGILKYKNDFDLSKESMKSITAVQNMQAYDTETVEEDSNSIVSKESTNKDEIVFMWQIMTSSTPLKDNDYRFKKLKCSFYKENNIYKYTYGSSTDYKEVQKLQADIKKLFSDAFIIAMKNGKRIDINEARKQQ